MHHVLDISVADPVPFLLDPDPVESFFILKTKFTNTHSIVSTYTLYLFHASFYLMQFISFQRINELRPTHTEFERDYYESLLIVLDTLEKCLSSQVRYILETILQTILI